MLSEQQPVTKQSRGFSLLELMIVVAIVGIIASIAYPGYQSFIAGSKRSVAQADLMAFAAAMERHNAAKYSYLAAASGGGNTGSPAVFAAHSPASEPSSNKAYDLTIHNTDARGTTYILKATPVKGSSLANDGALFLFSDGRKAWDQNNNGSLEAADYCWSC